MATDHAPAVLAPAVEPRPRTLLVGTLFAIAACTMFFAGVFGVFLKLHADAGDEFIDKDKISLVPGSMMMLTAALSVVVMAWAVQAIKNDDRKNAYIALALTMLFGIANINQQVFFYRDMGLKVAESASSLLIYVISGAHIVMLIAALLFVGTAAFRALAGQYSSRQADGIEAAAYFWYATVAIYACIWYGIYVTK